MPSKPSVPSFKYTDAQWSEIVTACPKIVPTTGGPAPLTLRRARLALQKAGSIYRGLHLNRLERPKRSAAKRHLDEIDDLIAKAKEAQLTSLLPDLSDARERAIIAINDRKLLDDNYQRRSNPNNDMLYQRTIVIWEMLGGERKISRNGKPGGPAIRFFLAVLTPIMEHETPKTETIAKIIKLGRVPTWPAKWPKIPRQ